MSRRRYFLGGGHDSSKGLCSASLGAIVGQLKSWIEADAAKAGGRPDARMLRLGAHLLIWLQGVLPDGGGFSPSGPLFYDLNQVVQAYSTSST